MICKHHFVHFNFCLRTTNLKSRFLYLKKREKLLFLMRYNVYRQSLFLIQDLQLLLLIFRQRVLCSDTRRLMSLKMLLFPFLKNFEISFFSSPLLFFTTLKSLITTVLIFLFTKFTYYRPISITICPCTKKPVLLMRLYCFYTRT